MARGTRRVRRASMRPPIGSDTRKPSGARSPNICGTGNSERRAPSGGIRGSDLRCSQTRRRRRVSAVNGCSHDRGNGSDDFSKQTAQQTAQQAPEEAGRGGAVASRDADRRAAPAVSGRGAESPADRGGGGNHRAGGAVAVHRARDPASIAWRGQRHGQAVALVAVNGGKSFGCTQYHHLPPPPRLWRGGGKSFRAAHGSACGGCLSSLRACGS